MVIDYTYKKGGHLYIDLAKHGVYYVIPDYKVMSLIGENPFNNDKLYHGHHAFKVEEPIIYEW